MRVWLSFHPFLRKVSVVERCPLWRTSAIRRFHCTYFHLNFVWKVSDGETESNVLVTFVVWQCLNCWWVRKGGWAESLIQGWLKLHYFSGGVLAKAISMTHFSMLCKLDIISMHFIFMSRCCFRFSSVHPLFQILYSMKSAFLLKYMLRFFTIKFEKIIEIYVVHTWGHMQSELVK